MLFGLLAGVLGFGGSVRAASLLSKVDFEQELNDPYDFVFFENPGTVTGYVPGHTGYAVRSSHSSDDNRFDNPNGYGLVITTTGGNGNNYWPASDELYISYWIKYEKDYYNPCNNIKWLWTYGDDHNELIFGSQTDTDIRGRWFLQRNNCQAWSHRKAARYWTADYVMGNWMHVEIYYKLSTGANHSNYDGTQWLKVNGITVISDNQVSTGKPGRMSVPSINASGNGYSGCEAGHGWFQLDDYEIWDGIPTSGPDTTPPSCSNSQPTGTLSSGTTQTTISLTTNETAVCKYSTIAGTNYDSITNTFSSTNSTTHSQTISNLSDGNTYHYYVRCQDESGNQNPDDFEISFSVASPPHTVYGLSNFIQLVADWLKSEPPALESDVNGDGVVNTRDLGIMMSNWGE